MKTPTVLRAPLARRGCGRRSICCFRRAAVAAAPMLPTAQRRVPLCDDCRDQLPLIDWPVCPRCAAPVPTTDGVELTATIAAALSCGSIARGAGKLRGAARGSGHADEGRPLRLVGADAGRSWRGSELGEQLVELQRRRRHGRADAPAGGGGSGASIRRGRLAERLADKLGVPAAGGMLRLSAQHPAADGVIAAGAVSQRGRRNGRPAGLLFTSRPCAGGRRYPYDRRHLQRSGPRAKRAGAARSDGVRARAHAGRAADDASRRRSSASLRNSRAMDAMPTRQPPRSRRGRWTRSVERSCAVWPCCCRRC